MRKQEFGVFFVQDAFIGGDLPQKKIGNSKFIHEFHNRLLKY